MSVQPVRYVPYSDSVETVRPDEDHVTAEIVASMRRIGEITADRYRHAVQPRVGPRDIGEVPD